MTKKALSEAEKARRTRKKRKRKESEQEQAKRLNRQYRKYRETLSLERGSLEDLFAGEPMKRVVVPTPAEMKNKFEAWCMGRGFTVEGRIRKFMLDCITGVFRE